MTPTGTVARIPLGVGAEPRQIVLGPDRNLWMAAEGIEEVEPPHRLRFEDGFADDDGKPKEELPTTVATVTIAEADDTTTMSIESRFAGREQPEQVVEMGMEQGIREAVGQIDAILGGRT